MRSTTSRSATGLAGFGLGLLSALAGCGGEPAPEPLRIAVHAAPSSLDPHLQSEAAALSVLVNVYEGLTTFDGEMALQPALASRWDTPEERVWRFFLRRDVRFHDGRPLTAEDVVASLERVRRPEESRTAGLLVEVEDVRASGPGTVEIRTRRPYPMLAHKLALAFIAPADAPAEIREPVGTGPYRLVEWRPEGIRLEAFEGYWKGTPPEPAAVFQAISDRSKRLEELLAGRVDVINEVAPEDVASLRDVPDVRIEAVAGMLVDYLQVRTDVAPFDDLRVRHALALAVDREALVAEALAGQGRPVYQMASPQVVGFAADLEATRPDPVAARRLLAEAGYSDGVEVELEHRTSRGPQLLAHLSSQLEAAGFRVRRVPRPWSELYPRLQSGAVAFYYGGWIFSSGDASELFDHKIHTRDPATGYGDSNSNGYSNPSLDRMIEEAGALSNMVERRRALEACMRLLMTEDVLIPLFVPFELYATDASIDWRPRPGGRIHIREIARRPAP